jgi:BirA family transcriptional regulator, biotin operon repressor / biotin---[acetyl-CoA-carboxylase] ligase
MTANCILERVAETQSTNDDLLARWRAGELIDPVARLAHKQTAGKGRVGRNWFAKPGDSISFSLAYPFSRNPAQLTGLSLLVGLAVIDGIAKALNIDRSALHQSGLRLKWPNDLLLNDHKLGGILIEGGQAKPGDTTWMIIGVGLNLRNAPEIEAGVHGQTGLKVGTLEQLIPQSTELPDTEYLWLKFIESLEQFLEQFDTVGFKPYQEQWQYWDAYFGKAVTISGSGKELANGIEQGIDQNGALLIQQNGKTEVIHAGDLSLREQL